MVGCPGIAQDVCDVGKFLVKSGGAIGLAGELAPEAAGEGFETLADGAFGAMAARFGEAGISFLQSLAEAFVAASTVDLSDAGVDPVLAITMPIAMLAAVLLVVTAAGKAAASGNGSVVATALVGLVKTVLVTVLLVAVTQMALKASDALTMWITNSSLGGNQELEQRLGALISLEALGGSAALVLIFGLLAVIVAFVLWVELLFRQVAIVVLVAVAPIAATGQILHETSEWWTKARNALIQLIMLKPLIALCFAVGFSTLGSAGDLMGVVGGFVTLMLAAVAWPLLARFMTFTSVGAGHGALAGVLGTGAGFLAGRKMHTAAAPTGPGAATGAEYSTALERQNDTAAATSHGGSSGGSGRLVTALAGRGGSTSGASAATGGGAAAGGVVAAVGAAATAAAAAMDHIEGQMTSAAAEAGLGHASRPGGTYGHTRGRFGGRGSHSGGRHEARHPGGPPLDDDGAGGGSAGDTGPCKEAPPAPEPAEHHHIDSNDEGSEGSRS